MRTTQINEPFDAFARVANDDDARHVLYHQRSGPSPAILVMDGGSERLMLVTPLDGGRSTVLTVDMEVVESMLSALIDSLRGAPDADSALVFRYALRAIAVQLVGDRDGLDDAIDALLKLASVPPAVGDGGIFSHLLSPAPADRSVDSDLDDLRAAASSLVESSDVFMGTPVEVALDPGGMLSTEPELEEAFSGASLAILASMDRDHRAIQDIVDGSMEEMRRLDLVPSPAE
jgi:hypothetical protein